MRQLNWNDNSDHMMWKKKHDFSREKVHQLTDSQIPTLAATFYLKWVCVSMHTSCLSIVIVERIESSRWVAAASERKRFLKCHWLKKYSDAWSCKYHQLTVWIRSIWSVPYISFNINMRPLQSLPLSRGYKWPFHHQDSIGLDDFSFFFIAPH